MGRQFSVDMEGEGQGNIVLEKGEYDFEIMAVELKESKTTNPETGDPNKYFLWKLKELSSDGFMDCRTTLIKKKRWLLKQLLEACGITADEDDPEKKYEFNEDDVVGKVVRGKVETKPETFTGNDGQDHTVEKSNITRFFKKGGMEDALTPPKEKKKDPGQKTKDAGEPEENIPFGDPEPPKAEPKKTLTPEQRKAAIAAHLTKKKIKSNAAYDIWKAICDVLKTHNKKQTDVLAKMGVKKPADMTAVALADVLYTLEVESDCDLEQILPF